MTAPILSTPAFPRRNQFRARPIGLTNGTLTLNPDGTFTYTPNTHYVGRDSFTYTWSDGLGISNRGTVTIRVENGTPSGGADYFFDEDFILVDDVEGWLYTADRSVLDNDYDPDEDGISIVGIQDGPRHGDAYLDAEGRLWYRPTVPLDRREATDTLTYIVSDGVSQVVATVQIMLQQPFLAEKGEKKEYKPPDVPADRIQGPGRMPIPHNSVVFISDKSVWGDSWSIWWNAPSGTPVHNNIASWQQLVGILEPLPNASIAAIVISGHGGDGGVQTAGGQDSWIVARTLTDEQAGIIREKVAPGGVVILLACGQASGNWSVRDQEGNLRPPSVAARTKELARKIGLPVIANQGNVRSGNYGDGDWYGFSP